MSTWHVYAMTAAGLGIIYLFPYVPPKIGKLIPIAAGVHHRADCRRHVGGGAGYPHGR